MYIHLDVESSCSYLLNNFLKMAALWPKHMLGSQIHLIHVNNLVQLLADLDLR
jgi:hypothetical protein